MTTTRPLGRRFVFYLADSQRRRYRNEFGGFLETTCFNMDININQLTYLVTTEERSEQNVYQPIVSVGPSRFGRDCRSKVILDVI